MSENHCSSESDAARRSIHVDGLHHGASPIPLASVVRGVLVSGAVLGLEPHGAAFSSDPSIQIGVMFENVARILEAAGGSTGDIVKMTIFLDPTVERALLDPAWLQMFPDPDARPARHVQAAPHLRHGMVVQCEVMAVLS